MRNRPSESQGDDFDSGLTIGAPTGMIRQGVVGSYNDLFSRPLAVVGNTGSGKSCSIAHLIQEATCGHDSANPRFFVLDINGEYGPAFGIPEPAGGRQPNVTYANGIEFGVPLWLMNASDVCQWLSAAEQVQEPTLKNLWSAAKGKSTPGSSLPQLRAVQQAIIRLENLDRVIEGSGPYKGQNALGQIEAAKGFFAQAALDPAVVVRAGSRGRLPLAPRVVAAGGDPQRAAHAFHGELGPVVAHELERPRGVDPVS